MNVINPLSELERAQQQLQTERERDLGRTCNEDGDGFRKTELFSDYPPGPSHTLTPVVMQNAKENPGLSTGRVSESAEIPSESNQRISDLLTLTLKPAEPSIDQIRMGDQSDTESGAFFSECPQETPEFAEEEEMEPDFLLEVKMEEEEEELPEQPEGVIRDTGKKTKKSKKKEALAQRSVHDVEVHWTEEPPELQEIIDMSSFTDGIYICEVSQAAQIFSLISLEIFLL